MMLHNIHLQIVHLKLQQIQVHQVKVIMNSTCLRQLMLQI